MEPVAITPHRAWRPWAVALSLWLALAAVTGAALWHLRLGAVDSQARELRVLSLALNDAIDRGLRGADEGLQTMGAELHEGRLPLTGQAAVRSLQTRAGLMPLVQSLWLVDSQGAVIAASGAAAPPDLASFAPALAQTHESGAGAVSLSLPFLDEGRRSVALAVGFDIVAETTPAPAAGSAASAAAHAAAHRRSGWIVAAMPAADLLGAFGAALPAADTRLWVFRGDGALLAGANLQPATLVDAIVPPPLAHRPSLQLRRFRDGSDNLVGTHGVARYDVKVVVSRSLDSVLQAWRQAAELAGTALAVLLLIMATAVCVVQRADRRRADAQRALQAQVSRAGKLESLGALAGGVAHDFNNVLAAIVGFGEMAQDAATPGSAQARHIDKAMQAALRGKALVERILAFGRGGARASTVFELQPVVEEVLTLLSASLRAGLVLERVLEAPGGRLRGDPTQAFEAVMNLCANALQAMPEGGMLSVQLQRLRIAETRVLSHSRLAAGDYLTLAVADQGAGITPEVMEHLFEPFFTTRAAQSGTGLGLAVVFGVVAEFGGAIDVQSGSWQAKGQGACFTLFLPECHDAVAPADAEAAPAAAGTGQRLLVVDDEPELVALAEEMLSGLGYSAVGFHDSRQALQALRDEPHRFAAVITDEVMPGLSGTGLTQALRRHAPGLPVLLVSGYGGALLAQRAAAAGVTRVLAKPLQRADLARALAELLR